MSDRWIFLLTFGSALGCGLAGGVFFAFSTFVMKALTRIPAAEGIAAMQAINVAVINPAFMVALFGTAATCALLAVFALLTWSGLESLSLLAGAVIYLVGTVLVTMVFNVPRNEALAAVDPASPDGARVWADYVVTWTAWNHVRTVAAMVAAATLMVALQSMRGAGTE